MLSIQYLHVTPKCVFCSNIEISTHLDFKDTQYPSRTPLKYENGRYCSFRQKYFGHWSDALNSDQRKNFDQRSKISLITARVPEQIHCYWSRKILGWRQDFLRWEQLWPEAPILKPSRISWKRKDVRDRAIKGDVNFDFRILWLNSNPERGCQGSSQREFHSRQNVIIPIIRWLYLIIPI